MIMKAKRQAFTVRQFTEIIYGEATDATIKRTIRMILAGTLKATKMQGLGLRSPYMISRKELDRLISLLERERRNAAHLR